MIIGVMSDMHLGYRQYGLIEREQDFYKQFDKCIDELMKCDVVVIAGDIFDKPTPSPESILVFQNGLNKLTNNGIKVVGVKGNHTMLKRKDHIAADEIFSNNYQLLDIDSIGDKVNFFGIDYCGPETDKFYEQLKKAKQNIKNGLNILVVHEAFAEYCGFSGEPLVYKDIDWGKFDIVITGHIHNAVLDDMVVPAFLQPGSIERSSMTEVIDEELNGKGIWKIIVDEEDLSYAFDFVRIESDRKFFFGEWTIDEQTEISDMREWYQVLQDQINQEELEPIVSFKIYNKGNDLSIVKDFDSSIENCLVVNNKYYDMDIEREIKAILNEDGTLPSVEQVLKERVADYPKELGNLMTSIYKLSNVQDKDTEISLEALIDDYFQVQYDSEIKNDFIEKHNIETKEYIEFFENL